MVDDPGAGRERLVSDRVVSSCVTGHLVIASMAGAGAGVGAGVGAGPGPGARRASCDVDGEADGATAIIRRIFAGHFFARPCWDIHINDRIAGCSGARIDGA